jgi:hypothetical protein
MVPLHWPNSLGWFGITHYAILHHFGRNAKYYPTPYYNEWFEQGILLSYLKYVLELVCDIFMDSLWFFSLCRSKEYDHVKENLVHMLYHIQRVDQIPLKQFKNIIPDS